MEITLAFILQLLHFQPANNFTKKTWISNYVFNINIVKKQLGNRISRENFTPFRRS